MTEPNLSASGINRKLTALDMEREALIEKLSAQLEHAEAKGSDRRRKARQAEDVLVWVAVGLAAIKGVSEIFHEWVGMLVELKPHAHPFPWVFICLFLGALLPKLVGRATAGKVWESIGAGIGRRIGGGKDDGMP